MPFITLGAVIKRDGDVLSRWGNGGQQFNVLHPKPGVYQINFTPDFTGLPAVTVQHYWDISNAASTGGAIHDTATVEGITNSGMTVMTGDNKGNVSDRDFAFIAIGNIP
jgi:hypothetical protein